VPEHRQELVLAPVELGELRELVLELRFEPHALGHVAREAAGADELAVDLPAQLVRRGGRDEALRGPHLPGQKRAPAISYCAARCSGVCVPPTFKVPSAVWKIWS
jgi:hypothetical protein